MWHMWAVVDSVLPAWSLCLSHPASIFMWDHFSKSAHEMEGSMPPSRPMDTPGTKPILAVPHISPPSLYVDRHKTQGNVTNRNCVSMYLTYTHGSSLYTYFTFLPLPPCSANNCYDIGRNENSFFDFSINYRGKIFFEYKIHRPNTMHCLDEIFFWIQFWCATEITNIFHGWLM